MTVRPGSSDDSDLSEELRDRVFVAYYSPSERVREIEIERLCADHPADAAAIRRQVATLQRADEMLGVVELPDPDEAPAIPEQLGDYHLERQIGSGGMGIVFLARQAALDRRVALKVVRPERLPFEGARLRFRREVAAVGRLSHFGIAAVHDVGEASGLPYIVMEAIPGISLAQVIEAARARRTAPCSAADMSEILTERRPEWVEPGSDDRGRPHTEMFAGSWSDAAVRIARELAMALHHAHERGIIHRDVKPSNVLITPEGRVVLIDFGLARIGETSDLTRSGTAVGSFAYMSPEQVQRYPVDARTDVYSVGLTLLELLSLRPAFDEDDPIAMRERIVRGVVPDARSCASGVSTDLAVVCAVASELDPARRYATAGALARDLDRVLAGVPIQARPVPWSRKVWRWVRRNRAKTVAATTTALLVVGAPTVLWQIERSANRELLRQRERAEAGLLASTDVVERLLSQMSARVADLPHLAGVRAGMLRDALLVLEELAGKFDETGRLHGIAAGAALSRGRLLMLLGKSGEALQALDEAERLAELSRSDGERNRILARIRAHQTVGRFRIGDLAKAAESAADARTRLEAILAEDSADQTLVDLLTGHLSITASIHLALNDAARSRAMLDESVARREAQVRQDGPDYDNQLALARELRQRGFVATDASAAKDTERAIGLLRQARAERPGDPSATFHLAAALGDRATQRRRAGDRVGALTIRREVLELRERLTREFPSVALYTSECAAALHNLAHDLESGDPRRRELLTQAVEMQRRAHAEDPRDLRFHRYLTNHYVSLADEWRRLGDYKRMVVCASDLLEARIQGHRGAFEASLLLLDAADLADEESTRSGDVSDELRGRAMAALARAVSVGMPIQVARDNVKLAPLVSDPRFAESLRAAKTVIDRDR